MSKRRFVTGVLMAGAIASGGVAMASPAWAAPSGAPTGSSTGASAGSGASDVAPAACSLYANPPGSSSGRLSGYGSRWGCGNTVNYFWVRVYKHINFWPDSEKAVRGATHWRNGGLTASGGCDGRGVHYTHVSTRTGLGGEDLESRRVTIC